MPIQVIAPIRDQRLNEQLALAQLLAQGAQGFEAYREQQRAEAQRNALARLLGGEPAEPSAIGAGTGFAGSPELAGGVSTGAPRQPGLIPGATPERAAQWVAAGLGPTVAQIGLQQRFPDPLTPYQQAQLDLARQGQTLDQEALELRRQQAAAEEEYRRAQLALGQRDLEQRAAAAGSAAAPKLSDIRNARLDYRDDSAPFVELATNYGKLQSALRSGTGEGDLAAIFSFMKALDPSSVVREGEAATAQNSSGALQGLWNYYNQVLSGQRLAPEQRQNFLNVAGNWLAQARDRQLTLEQQHRFQAEQAGIDPARVVPDVIGKYRDWTPPPPGGETPLQQTGQGIVGTIIEGGKEFLGLGRQQPQAGQEVAPDELGEGEIIRNKTTGERFIVRGGQLVPYDG